ncbi:hypothetical protein PCASD_14655 [Puccinia coronata f. sp. avenae]|uniref:Uncharacterized protein n=1 Tax=Puccinia coronata f. sp. avenae TaxID=200324 RepID=A0A2N5U499_9BASI|nr:hypothetical protein PCASD_14655 [Puccinia coronata f. sp. avenae]
MLIKTPLSPLLVPILIPSTHITSTVKVLPTNINSYTLSKTAFIIQMRLVPLQECHSSQYWPDGQQQRFNQSHDQSSSTYASSSTTSLPTRRAAHASSSSTLQQPALSLKLAFLINSTVDPAATH